MPEAHGYDNSGSGPLRVPGIGLPLDSDDTQDSLRWEKIKDKTWEWMNDMAYFSHGIGGWNGQRLTVREISMLALMESITDKPNWDTKVFDDAIVNMWRTEALQMPIISEATWAWVLAEVRDKAIAFKNSQRVLSLDTNARCAKSDVLVDEELREELCSGVAPLLAVPEEQKDWHPGSNNQVLNLVHPSLFPLVYGRTRVLAQGGRVGLTDLDASRGQGEVAEQIGDYLEEDREWSRRFQWLPCEVEFSNPAGTDTNVKITSYINNLHPTKHQGLYRAIEKIISLSIPLWNDVLAYVQAQDKEVRIMTNRADWTPNYREWANWTDLEMPTKTTSPQFPEVMQKLKELLALPNKPNFDTEDMDEEFDLDVNFETDDPDTICEVLRTRLEQIEQDPDSRAWDFEYILEGVVQEKWKRIRSVAHPEPAPYEHFWKPYAQQSPEERVSLESSDWFRARGLQVIVKLASIELTPDQPQYPGGSWHLEGMKNEHIVSTAIYYYDVDNTTTAQLSFRQGASLGDGFDLHYEQGDHQPLREVFGMKSMQHDLAVQVIGRIVTPQGRLLAFPNTFQHKVEPFELVDKTKTGHRRFLVLWLVDPHYRICSTRNVPPQQGVCGVEEAVRTAELGKRLPQELVDMVKGEPAEWPIGGPEEAKELRLQLMAERTALSSEADQYWDSYNLCEH